MKRLAQATLLGISSLLLLQCAGCPYNPNPTGVGGAPGSGGAIGVGGAASGGTLPAVAGAGGVAVAGAASTGGAVATGGAATVVEWLECAPKTHKIEKLDIERYRRLLGPKMPEQKHRRIRASYTLLDFPDAGWDPLCGTLDQGKLSSCTGNAGIQVRVSKPWRWSGSCDVDVLELLAVNIYGGATRRDQWDGSYPPDDTGSDSGAAMAEMRDRGLISGWVEIVTFEGLQTALQKGPCSFDTNWYTSMFTPDRCGQVEVSGALEGGHAVKVERIQYSTKRVGFLNSWGRWGAKVRGQAGYFQLTFGNVQKLINEGAQIYCPRVDAGIQ